MNLAKYKEIEDLKTQSAKLSKQIGDAYTAARKTAMEVAKKDFRQFFLDQGFEVTENPIRESVSYVLNATYGSLAVRLEVPDSNPVSSTLRVLVVEPKGSTYIFNLNINNPRQQSGPRSWNIPPTEDKRLAQEKEMVEQEISRNKETIAGLEESQSYFVYVQELDANRQPKTSSLVGKQAPDFKDLLHLLFAS